MHSLGKILISIALLFAGVSCADLTVMSSSLNTATILTVEPTQAVAGDIITISGSGLNSNLTATIADHSVPLLIISKSQATFIMPTGLTLGTVKLTLRLGSKLVAEHGLFNNEATETAKLSTLAASDICSDVVFKDDKNVVQHGTRNCTVSSSDPISTTPTCTVDGQIGCVTAEAFPAIDKAQSLSPTNLAKIRNSVTIAGESGTLVDCASDNGTNCVASPQFPSVVASGLSPGLIKTGTTLAGVTGNYPSAMYPLAAGDGFADITTSNFDVKISTAANFGWYDRNGTRYFTSGDDDISVGKIKSGQTIFGALGNFAPPCATDGAVDCLTTSVYKSANTSAFSDLDIRLNMTIAGVTGKLTMFKSLISSDYDRITAPSVAGPDFYDTVDDKSPSFPTTVLPNFYAINEIHFIRDALSDTGVGGGIMNNGVCDGTEECVYGDNFTRTLWARSFNNTYTFDGAISYCDGLTYGGYSDWRLATQKEAMQFYINGARYLSSASRLDLPSTGYWTSTSVSTNTNYGWFYDPMNGFTSDENLKTDTFRALCIR